MKKQASKALIREVMKHTHQALVERGFTKRKEQIYTRTLDDEFLGWLGLNRAVSRGEGDLAINPVVGVRYQRLERMLAEVRGKKYHPYIPPTLSINVGYLTPENSYQTWLFEEGGIHDSTVTEMVDGIERYGYDFMQEMSDVQAIRAALESEKFSLPGSPDYRLPVLCYLQGEIPQAREWLKAFLDKIGDREDPAAENYRQFANAFMARLP